MSWGWVVFAGALGMLPDAARAQPPSPFSQGHLSFSARGGGGIYGSERYVVLGGGVSVFVLDGLEIGVEGEHWFGDPDISKVSPQLRYVVFGGAINPYFGAFFRRWFLSGDHLDTLGGRGGILYAGRGHAFFGIGVAYETVLSACAGDCSALYPELSVAFIL